MNALSRIFARFIFLRQIAVLSLCCGAFSGFASDRVFLGNHLDFSLAVSTDPNVAQNLINLRHQALTKSVVRIIVGTRTAFAPEALLTTNGATQQRDEIAAAQSTLLAKVLTLAQRPESIKRFQSIPFMALEVKPSELEALVNLPEVTSIEEDRLLVAHLAESVPLIGGSGAWASGYTGAGQTVAILDTGVEKTHPFLAGKVISEACYSTNSVYDGASSICPGGITASTAVDSAMPYASGVCPTGECDHGTHVAGIVAGTGNSFSGVAKGSSVIAVQVFSRFTAAACGATAPCSMSYKSDEIQGLLRVYALRNSYSIAAVNMSLGGGQYFQSKFL